MEDRKKQYTAIVIRDIWTQTNSSEAYQASFLATECSLAISVMRGATPGHLEAALEEALNTLWAEVQAEIAERTGHHGDDYRKRADSMLSQLKKFRQ
jgi:hypothetical protein